MKRSNYPSIGTSQLDDSDVTKPFVLMPTAPSDAISWLDKPPTEFVAKELDESTASRLALRQPVIFSVEQQSQSIVEPPKIELPKRPESEIAGLTKATRHGASWAHGLLVLFIGLIAGIGSVALYDYHAFVKHVNAATNSINSSSFNGQSLGEALMSLVRNETAVESPHGSSPPTEFEADWETPQEEPNFVQARLDIKTTETTAPAVIAPPPFDPLNPPAAGKPNLTMANSLSQAAYWANQDGKLVYLIHGSATFESRFKDEFLSDVWATEFLNKHFVVAIEQVGRQSTDDVVGYFCTPSGRVIHAVIGSVDTDELLQEAQWAVDSFKPIKGQSLRHQEKHIARAHVAAFDQQARVNEIQLANWRRGNSKQERVHRLLAFKPLASISNVYCDIFGNLFGKQVSRRAPNLQLAAHAFGHAKEEGRPILFVVHQEGDNAAGYDEWLRFLKSTRLGDFPIQTLLRDYEVVVLPLGEATILSHQFNEPLFVLPEKQSPRLIIAGSDGRQISSVMGYKYTEALMVELARGWIEAAKVQSPSLDRLQQAKELLSEFIPGFENQLDSLIEQERGETVEAKPQVPQASETPVNS